VWAGLRSWQLLIRRQVGAAFKILPLLIAVGALGVFAPATQNDRIGITSESLYLRTGARGSPNEHSFLLRDAVGIKVITKPDLKGRPDKYMRVTLKNGAYDDVPMGDLFRLHEEEILQAVTDGFEKAARVLHRE
jgi:hypothetical protein